MHAAICSTFMAICIVSIRCGGLMNSHFSRLVFSFSSCGFTATWASNCVTRSKCLRCMPNRKVEHQQKPERLESILSSCPRTASTSRFVRRHVWWGGQSVTADSCRRFSLHQAIVSYLTMSVAKMICITHARNCFCSGFFHLDVKFSSGSSNRASPLLSAAFSATD